VYRCSSRRCLILSSGLLACSPVRPQTTCKLLAIELNDASIRSQPQTYATRTPLAKEESKSDNLPHQRIKRTIVPVPDLRLMWSA